MSTHVQAADTAGPAAAPARTGRTARRDDRRNRRSNSAGARQRAERRAAALFLAPDLIGLTVFLALPMAATFVLAFFRVSGFGEYEFIGLENFRRMLGDPMFFRSLGTTLIYVFVLVPVTFAVSLGLALLVKKQIPFIGVFRAAFFLPYSISVVVVGLVWEFLLADGSGVVNKVLESMGVQPPSWLGDPSYALGTVIVVGVWFWMGYYMIILLAGLQDIPKDYYDAARLDGAGALACFRHVTWPLLRPTTFFVLLMATVAALTGGFELILVLTSGGPANATSILVFYIYQQAFTFGEFGYASALASVLVVALLAWSLLLFAATRGGRFDNGR
ncbi:sugar ABC transporter permease [Streptomonospora sediminis]